MNKPFFVAIGPPKTGTTWIYAMLKKHPEVTLPPYKEIRYFWAKAFLKNIGFMKKLFSRHWYFKKKRRYFINKLQTHLRSIIQLRINWFEFIWDLKFFILPCNDKWYLNLFDNKKVSGDVSPNYCELPEKEIEKLKSLIPDAKIIISLRDPIDRQWSRVRMKLRVRSKKNNFSGIADRDEFINSVLENELKNKCSDYVELVKNWSKYFPRENVFVFFYEELRENPGQLFNELCIFLGIDLINITGTVKEKVNEGINLDITPKYLNFLIEQNINYLDKMPSYFTKKYPEEWLKKYRSINDEVQEQNVFRESQKF